MLLWDCLHFIQAIPHFCKKNGGERGIRTLGQLPVVGFQDRCLKPLDHLSANLIYYVKYTILSDFTTRFSNKLHYFLQIFNDFFFFSTLLMQSSDEITRPLPLIIIHYPLILTLDCTQIKSGNNKKQSDQKFHWLFPCGNIFNYAAFSARSRSAGVSQLLPRAG